MAELVLHIGQPKTGTTTLQATLAASRPALRGAGVLYPRAFGVREHVGFALLCADPRRDDHRPTGPGGRGTARRRWLERKGFQSRADLEAWGRGQVARFEKEIARARPDRILISSETLWVDLRTPREIARLRALLSPCADRIRIVVYLRRQDDYVRSLHSTALRHGRTRRLHWLDGFRRYDTLARLNLWADAFGDAPLTVRPYERDALAGADIVQDFCEVADLPLDALERTEDRNPTLSADGVEILRLANREMVRLGVPGLRSYAVRRRVIDAIAEAGHDRPPFALPAGMAARLRRRHEAINAGIARRWLGRADGRLFSDAVPRDADARPTLPPGELRARMRRMLAAALEAEAAEPPAAQPRFVASKPSSSGSNS